MVDRSPTDAAMERYAGGDDSAFIVVYEALRPRLLDFSIRRARSREVAEDAVQQTFLQIINARDRFIPGAPVVPWAYAIARHLLTDGYRGRREAVPLDGAGDGPEGIPEPADGGPSPEEVLDRRRRVDRVRGDLARLLPRWREAFELVALEELSVAEAAEVLGISEANVKIRVHRAREALRRRDR